MTTQYFPSNNIDFNKVDWVELCKQLGIRANMGEIVELTKFDSNDEQFNVACQYASTILNNPKIPFDYVEDQLDILEAHNKITSFDRACIKIYVKRIIKEMGTQ